ncbi:lipoprotein [Actinorhabdospora filicis]|uniref:Lipoprotein n=1 Tax=Actinorhabdospora filicis TaxID=1785913 RepID=A0A9W6SI94_9ACTN|nr:ABC transporter substrate-binding protein [Actinorhabdospora filicis]GLZ76006.1 lipoprotein [Actinorhabdospora filicis]
MSSRRYRLGAVIASVLLAAVALTACGGSDDAGSGAGGEAATLKLGYFPNITHAPALVGVKNGIFAEKLGANTKLETLTFNAGPAAIEALFSGAIDATFIGPNPAINGWSKSKGTALRIIAGSTSGGAGLVVREGINTPADLKGKKLATPQLGNTQDVALRAWLKANGLTADTQGGGDVSIQPTANADAVTAFASGNIDGAWVPEPYLSTLVLKNKGKVLVNEKDLWPGGQFVTTHLIVRAEFLEKYPETVKKLLDGHIAAVDYTVNNPAEAQKAASAQLEALSGKKPDDAVIAAAWQNLTFTVDPVATSLATSAQHAQDVGLLDPVDLKGIYAIDLLNERLKAAGKPEINVGALAP